MIRLRAMNQDDFSRWSTVSFNHFVEDMARASGKNLDEVRSEVGPGPSKMSADDLWNVVELDGVDIGFFWIKINTQDRSAFGYDIWLGERWRSKGIGREVMLAGKTLLSEHGINCLRVCVFDENRIAMALYQSLGFYETAYDAQRRQHHLEIRIPTSENQTKHRQFSS